MVIGEPVAGIARAVATGMVPAYGERVRAEVEAAIHAGGEAETPDQYFDVVAVGGLVVAIATLAWQVYTDRKKKGSAPRREVLATAVRVERSRDRDLSGAEKEIIELVAVRVTEQDDGE